MAGISSKAAGKLENRYKYNGNKLESGEFSDGSGLEMYDFNARTYDQQIGRFMQIDPEVEDGQESWTPYHFGLNNPILNDDPDGKNPIKGILKLGSIVMRVIKAEQKLSEIKNIKLDDVIKEFGWFKFDEASLAKSQASLKAAIDASKEKAADEAGEKKVPNPNGKKGGEAHQKGVDKAENNLKKEGYDNTQREVKVETPDGEKSSRYIDVRDTKTKTGETKDVQVGKQNKNGTPVARERRAMDDIKKETGKKPEFLPYNKPNN